MKWNNIWESIKRSINSLTEGFETFMTDNANIYHIKLKKVIWDTTVTTFGTILAIWQSSVHHKNHGVRY